MASTVHDDERLIATPGGHGAGDGFDDADDDRRARRTSRWLFISAIAVGGIAIAAVVWYLGQTAGGRDGEGQGQLPLLTADNEPVKVRPDDPGGAEIPNRDKYVFKNLDGKLSAQPVEQLLPAPEEPMAKPVETGPALQPLDNVTITEATLRADGVAADSSAARLPMAAQEAQALANAGPNLTTPGLAPDEPASNRDEIDQARADTAETISELAGAETITAETQAAAEVGTIAPAAGGVWLQLAALSDEAAANAEWSRIAKKHGDALGAAQPSIERAELGARGVWYRVRIGPFADRAAADAACQTLTARRQACRIVRP